MIDWITQTVPFTQLMGERVNVVGGIWLIALTLLTGNFLKKVMPFYNYKKPADILMSYLVGFLLPMAFYKIVDSAFMFSQILSNHSYMVRGSDLINWSWQVFWITSGLCLVGMLIIERWLIKTFRLGNHLKLKFKSIFLAGIIIIFLTYHMVFYPYDYAVLEGQMRVDVYWATYPWLFTLYGLLYLSFWRGWLIGGLRKS